MFAFPIPGAPAGVPSIAASSADRAAFQAALLGWYDASGRRLNFRATKDPYAVLVSEAMAQQTQVARVEPAWAAFMARFPTAHALAEASSADVIREWRGLGYNRRALNLQRATQAVGADFGGRIPQTVAELERLPGIGPYTARAVAAIAFGLPVGAVDTNVRRVLGRVVAGASGPPSAGALQALADAVVPAGRAADWTHAVMDVGATFCRPRRPLCAECPARAWCRAAAAGIGVDGGSPARAAIAAAPRQPSPAFPSTTRWLRGRILDRARVARRRLDTVRRTDRGPRARGGRGCRHGSRPGRPARARCGQRNAGGSPAPMSEAGRINPAVRAEPQTVGTAGARDPLAREVKLLGALLGQVIVEQGGPDLLDLVERVRQRTIALRRQDDPAERSRLAEDLDSLDLGRIEALIRSFSLYFQLVNLAEERQRVRTLRRRAQTAASGFLDESVAEALKALVRSGRSSAEVEALLARMRISPVMTAHPTEARRRTLLVALRRSYRLLERLDDPRITPDEDREVRRRLREEISLLWRTSDLRVVAPSPLDEVRTAMTFFDETLFSLIPQVYRTVDAGLDATREAGGIDGRGGERVTPDDPPASDTGRTGTRPPLVPAFLHWGSWIGGDRDGNPNVTAETTHQALRIHADHVLHGLEAVATRLSLTIAAVSGGERLPAAFRTSLARDGEELSEVTRQLRERFPDEPYRQRLGAIVERLRRTRAFLTESPAPRAGRYEKAEDLDAELAELQAALAADGLGRVAWGEVQDFRWQVQTFGFHVASLEVRQHSSVHRAALDVLRAGGDLETEVAPGVTTAEVLATFREIAAAQARLGERAAHRFVVSFTAGPQDAERVGPGHAGPGLPNPGRRQAGSGAR